MENMETKSATMILESEAKAIVGNIIQQSINQMNPSRESAAQNVTTASENGIHNDESDAVSELQLKSLNIDWGSIGDFTIEYGEEKINEYIKVIQPFICVLTNNGCCFSFHHRLVGTILSAGYTVWTI